MAERDRASGMRGDLDPSLSSTGMLLAHRRFRRYVAWGVLSLFALPLFVFLVIGLVSGGTTDSLWGVLGILAVMLLTLFLALLPFLLLAGFVVAVVLAVVQHRRKATGRDVLAQRVAWFPPRDGGSSAAAGELVGTVAAPPLERPPEPGFPEALAQLEALRSGIARTARRRERTFVPLTAASVFLCWFLADFGRGGQGSPLVAMALTIMLAAGFVWIWIRHEAQARYAKAFKAVVMPRLVGRYGELRYGPMPLPPLGPLVGFGLLPPHETAAVDDGIDGIYRDHRLRIAELVLKAPTKKNGKSLTEVYRGLLVDFETAAPLSATTVVVDKANSALRPSPERRALARIRLEDPLFEEVYAVFGTDQIASRALLTPATMQRLLVMADGQAYYPPYVLAHEGRVSFVTRRWDNLDLFEPASLFGNDATQLLAAQERGLADIFLLIDAMTTMRGSGRRSRSGATE